MSSKQFFQGPFITNQKRREVQLDVDLIFKI